jgi:ferrochelatase
MYESETMTQPYDAILILSFGGPEGKDDVIPFLENVLRGRNVPRERMMEVAHHYELFGGVSPINAQNRALIKALQQEFDAHDIQLPIYWGNRNWHPMLADALRQMAADGVKNALAFVTSAYSSYSGCRQYREDIQRAQAEVGEGTPQVSMLRKFYNHPGFIEPNVENIRSALHQFPAERQAATQLIFTAHSIPESMARTSRYEGQLNETCRLIASALKHDNWKLVYQSRSGAPGQPWLVPDIGEYIQMLYADGVTDMVIAPVGFISDHTEVLYDLDVEARQLADTLELHMVRAATVGVHPAFISMIRELIVERLEPNIEKRYLGSCGPSHDVCPADCCPMGQGRPMPAVASTH